MSEASRREPRNEPVICDHQERRVCPMHCGPDECRIAARPTPTAAGPGEPRTNEDADKLRDDIYAEISLVFGLSDDDDALVDAKNDATNAIMRHFAALLVEREAQDRLIEELTAQCDEARTALMNVLARVQDEAPVAPTARLRGHPVTWDGEVWRFSDGSVANNDRDCTKCGQPPTPEGHDACLGTLPDVTAACCGHGHPEDAYVITDPETLRRLRAQVRAVEALCDAADEASLRPEWPDFEPHEIPWTVAVRAALAAASPGEGQT